MELAQQIVQTPPPGVASRDLSSLHPTTGGVSPPVVGVHQWSSRHCHEHELPLLGKPAQDKPSLRRPAVVATSAVVPGADCGRSRCGSSLSDGL